MNADTVAQMSCNPAIGGVAKGQIVREIDALGGEMGKVHRRQPASSSACSTAPRARPCTRRAPRRDKKLYQFTMKHCVEEQPNLTLRQEMVEGLLLEKPPDRSRERAACGVVPRRHALPRAGRRPDHRHVPQGAHAHRRGEDARRPGRRLSRPRR